MTETEKRYNLLLQEVADLIAAKNSEIALLKWEKRQLEEALAEAERKEGKNAEAE